MNVTNITVRKVDHADPRYPEPMPAKPFIDVYLCSITLEGGEPFEAPYFVFEDQPIMTIDSASTMLKIFAGAIARMDENQKAA